MLSLNSAHGSKAKVVFYDVFFRQQLSQRFNSALALSAHCCVSSN